MGQRPRPSFFLIGYPKCGTTAFARFLRGHPELCMASPKEPMYFCPSWCRPQSESLFITRTESEYLDLFADAQPGQLLGDASTPYVFSPEAPALLHAFAPDAKLILVVREPASFVRSYHLQMLKNRPANRETERDLARAIALEPARRRGEHLPTPMQVPALLWYTTELLRYDEHYARWANLFPRAQMLLLTYDEVRADNPGTLRRILEFLDVDPTYQPDFHDRNVGGQLLRAPGARAWVDAARKGGGGPIVRAGKAIVPTPLRRRVVELAYRRVIFQDAPPVDETLAGEIRSIARPHVERLGEMIGRDLLALWGYAAQPAPAG